MSLVSRSIIAEVVRYSHGDWSGIGLGVYDKIKIR